MLESPSNMTFMNYFLNLFYFFILTLFESIVRSIYHIHIVQVFVSGFVWSVGIVIHQLLLVDKHSFCTEEGTLSSIYPFVQTYTLIKRG